MTSLPQFPLCYVKFNGQLLSSNFDEGPIPCQDGTNDYVNCCWAGDECLGSNLCRVRRDGNDGYYIASCTDQSYTDPTCLNYCTNGGAGLVYWNNSASAQNWNCCRPKPDGTADCSGSDLPPFPAPAPQDIRTLTSLESWDVFTSITANPPPLTTMPTTTTTPTAVSTTATPSAMATTTMTTPTSSSSSDSGLSGGAKAGIGVGVALGVLLIIAALVAWFTVRRRRRRNTGAVSSEGSPASWQGYRSTETSSMQKWSPFSQRSNMDTPPVYEVPTEQRFEIGGNARAELPAS